ncbi:hypothetical protein [Ekhidna sp.]|uniref:hypothetical protein n=1 Tax=Ekhidna sp. TaxID=2608089 RepID=UPI003299AA64
MRIKHHGFIMMGGAGHIADMNQRIKFLRSLIKRKRLKDNELLKMPIGKNSKIDTKTYLSKGEKLELSRKYLEYYKEQQIKNLKIALLSIAITISVITLLVYSFMALI